jgi:hypothetical protein
MIYQEAALVVVIQAWILLLQKRSVMRVAYPPVTYDLMLARDQESIANLNFIYNTNDVEVVQMLRDEKCPLLLAS